MQKYLRFQDEDNTLLIDWVRDSSEQNLDYKKNRYTFRLAASYGGKLKNLMKFIRWNLYIIKIVLKNCKSIKIIQICDLDSFFAVILFRFLGKKIVFDCYDFFTISKIASSKKPLYMVLYWIEMKCLKQVDLLVLPLDIRLKYLNFTPKNLFICENIPPITTFDKVNSPNEGALKIVYAGTLEANNRGLEWIPELAEMFGGKIFFQIAGSGELAEFFKDCSRRFDNIEYLGIITQEQSMRLQSDADLIFGIYRSNLLNNVMAAPNKFYESLCVGTPIIINQGVMISELIHQEKIGFIVGESKESVVDLLGSLDRISIKEASDNCLEYWRRHYAVYLNRKYQIEYTKIINDLLA